MNGAVPRETGMELTPWSESDPLVASWRGYKTLLSVRVVSAGRLKDIDKEGRLPHSGNLPFPFIHKS